MTPARAETLQAPVALQEQHGFMSRVSDVVESAKDKFADIAANVRGSKAVRVMAVAAASGALALSGCGGEDSPVKTASALDKADAEKCGEGSFSKKELDAGEKSRIIKEGLPATGSNEEARANVDVWFSKVKRDPELFAGTYTFLTDKDVKSEKLFDKEGCSTPYAEKREDKLTVMLSSSKIKAAKVPSNATNTGVNSGGELVQASTPGISGNRNGIKVEMLNGKTFYVLDRCGNLAKKGNPGLPEGPTDEPEPNTPEVPPKVDDDELPGSPNVPADQDAGTPDIGGNGPAGQTPGSDGYVDGENKPNTPTPKPTPAPLPEAPDTRPPQAPAQENPIPPTTGPGTPGNGSDKPTPTEEVEIN